MEMLSLFLTDLLQKVSEGMGWEERSWKEQIWFPIHKLRKFPGLECL